MSPPKAPILLQVESLAKLYPRRGGFFRKPTFAHAVEAVTLYVRKGETLGLVGESGSGKSTLARAILRLVEPTVGRVLFDGVDVTRLAPEPLRRLRKRMQIVFQDPGAALDPRRTVHELVAEGVELLEVARGRDAIDALVRETVRRVGLGEEHLDRLPSELSGGQRQRVGIARALAVGPDFLVCDEPVSALDPSVQAGILNLLVELQEERSLAMLFVSHDLRVVQHMAHRTAVMVHGRVVELGPTADVAANPLHPYTQVLTEAARRTGRSLPIVDAEPSSPLAPASGCAFHPRCARAEKGRCDVEVPELIEHVGGTHHRVACFHAGA